MGWIDDNKFVYNSMKTYSKKFNKNRSYLTSEEFQQFGDDVQKHMNDVYYKFNYKTR